MTTIPSAIRTLFDAFPLALLPPLDVPKRDETLYVVQHDPHSEYVKIYCELKKKKLNIVPSNDGPFLAVPKVGKHASGYVDEGVRLISYDKLFEHFGDVEQSEEESAYSHLITECADALEATRYRESHYIVPEAVALLDRPWRSHLDAIDVKLSEAHFSTRFDAQLYGFVRCLRQEKTEKLMLDYVNQKANVLALIKKIDSRPKA